MKGKALVAYFSCSGVTKNIAEKIAKAANADITEIQPKIPYTKEDLDWTNSRSRSSVEMKDSSSRPEIIKKDINIDSYDAVFLGFPIWWYVAPTVINTFLESYNFSGKTIIPFCTSGGSGFGNTQKILEKLCEDSVKWLPGKRFNANASDGVIEEWIKILDI